MGFGKRANGKWGLEYFGGLGALGFRVCKGLLEFSRDTDVNRHNKLIGSYIHGTPTVPYYGILAVVRTYSYS